MDTASLVEQLRAFVAERDWSQFHDPKNLAMLLASEAGELVAEYRWIRNENADAFSQEPEARQRVANEIKTTFASHYSRTISLPEALNADAIAAYNKKSTGEKFLINPTIGF